MTTMASRRMNILLVSGLGPEFPNKALLAGSSFEQLPTAPPGVRPAWPDRFDMSMLRTTEAEGYLPLLRPRKASDRIRPVSSVSVSRPTGGSAAAGPQLAPHLTTFTLQSILAAAGYPHDTFPTENIWAGTGGEPAEDFDVVLLSTTFIWDRASLAKCVRWVQERFPASLLVLGGQYSNLKYRRVLSEHTFVRYIVRGDAEIALPMLLDALRTGGSVGEIPNLAWCDPDTGKVCSTEVQYIDLDAAASPSLTGNFPVVPYESMRGCPFSCKYCSFPAASPKWRYKSAEKIAADFSRYRAENGAQYMKALDSTFTVPPSRLRSLLPMLSSVGVAWEAYTRANSIRDEITVRGLEDAHCRALSIGFESMNDTTLDYMHKQVRAQANRLAYELLAGSSIQYWISFIVGYPGESPELFQVTRDFLVSDYSGQFALYPFMLNDETMPVWQDAARFQLEVFDPDGESEHWRHIGMDSETARDLQIRTLREVRWKNSHAMQRTWQHDYELPLLPARSPAENTVVEKLVDRLGMVSADFTEKAEIKDRTASLLASLAAHGIGRHPAEIRD